MQLEAVYLKALLYHQLAGVSKDSDDQTEVHSGKLERRDSAKIEENFTEKRT